MTLEVPEFATGDGLCVTTVDALFFGDGGGPFVVSGTMCRSKWCVCISFCRITTIFNNTKPTWCPFLGIFIIGALCRGRVTLKVWPE